MSSRPFLVSCIAFAAVIAVPVVAYPPPEGSAPGEKPNQAPPGEGSPEGKAGGKDAAAGRAVANRPAAGKVAVPDSVQVVRDVIYAEAPDKDGKMIELKMDTAFLKEYEGAAMPVAVYIHGGGWSMGSKDMGLRPSIALALGGYFAVTIDYRLTGQATYPAAVHDCKAAIRFLRAHAEELGIDPKRIGVWGHSAGGHLAALLGTSGNSEVLDGSVGAAAKELNGPVQCVVDISGPVDLSMDSAKGMISQWFGGPVHEKQDIAKEASPLTYIDAKDPPVLIIQGTEDPLVNIDRQARVFEKALKDGGVKVEFLAVQGAGHAIADPRAYVRAAEFFDENLGGKSAGAVREFLMDVLKGERQPVKAEGKPESKPEKQKPEGDPAVAP